MYIILNLHDVDIQEIYCKKNFEFAPTQLQYL